MQKDLVMETIPPLWKFIAFFIICFYLFYTYASVKKYCFSQVRVRFFVLLPILFAILGWEDLLKLLRSLMA